MNCGFCGMEFPSDRGICWDCGVGYFNGGLIDYEGITESWDDIPSGCLLVLEKYSEEIK